MSHSGPLPADTVKQVEDTLNALFRQCAGEGMVTFTASIAGNSLVIFEINGQTRSVTNATSDILFQFLSKLMVIPYQNEGVLIRRDKFYLNLTDIHKLLQLLQRNAQTHQQQIESTFVPAVKQHEVKLWLHQTLQFLRAKIFTNPALDNETYSLLSDKVRAVFNIDIQAKTLEEVQQTVRDNYDAMVREITHRVSEKQEEKPALPFSSKPKKNKHVLFAEEKNKTLEIPSETMIDSIMDGLYQPLRNAYNVKLQAFRTTNESMSVPEKRQFAEELLALAKACEQSAPHDKTEQWQQKVKSCEAFVTQFKPKGPGL